MSLVNLNELGVIEKLGQQLFDHVQINILKVPNADDPSIMPNMSAVFAEAHYRRFLEHAREGTTGLVELIMGVQEDGDTYITVKPQQDGIWLFAVGKVEGLNQVTHRAGFKNADNVITFF